MSSTKKIRKKKIRGIQFWIYSCSHIDTESFNDDWHPWLEDDICDLCFQREIDSTYP